jgi:membrane protein
VRNPLAGHLVSIKDRLTDVPVVGDLMRAYARADGLRFMRWAAAIALFAYLSVFPLLVLGFMAFGAALHHFPGVQSDVESFLKDSVPLLFDPQGGQGAVDLQHVARTTSTAGIVSVVALVLTGLGWISSSIEGVRRMQGAMHRSRNALISKAQDIVTLLAVGTVLLLALVCSVLLQVVGSSALEWLGLSAEHARLVTLLAPALSGAILWLVLALLYAGAWWSRPHRQLRAPALGALWASIVLVMLTQMSMLLVGRTLSNPVYGTLAVAAALLVFLYFASAVMLYFAAWVAIVEGAAPTQEEVTYEARHGDDIALPTATPIASSEVAAGHSPREGPVRRQPDLPEDADVSGATTQSQ